MIRRGFTIVEALITMAIVGVVAALVLPTCISNYRKQVYASSLAASVLDFENAMMTLMMKENVDDLLDTKAWLTVESSGVYSMNTKTNDATIKEFMSNVAKVLSIEGCETEQAYYKKLDAPTSNTTVTFGDPIRFKTKNGPEYMIYIVDVAKSNAKSESDIVSKGGNYLNQAAEVYIDINGSNSPNVVGRDYFRFELGTDGHLYPFGGKDWAVYHDKTYTSPKTNCVKNKDGYYCAAYLTENGYKMDY